MELELQPLALPGIPQERPIVIAGPCSAETEEQVMCTAKTLAGKGIKIFRAGIWKPRTKPGGVEGIGVEGLAWMKRVKEETGMLISTEVATPKHVEEALNVGMDILWVGARTTANPFAVQELAESLKGVAVPVPCDCTAADLHRLAHHQHRDHGLYRELQRYGSGWWTDL